MPDREKVVEGLEKVWDAFNHMEHELYADYVFDALALLKEQEAKPPAIMQDIEGVWSTCSMCGHKLRPILAIKMDTYFPKFCSECGQAVKWE